MTSTFSCAIVRAVSRRVRSRRERLALTARRPGLRLDRGQRRGTVLENTPADHLALPKRVRLAEIPDDLDSAARAGRMDFRVEDDVVAVVAQVAVGPAVVLPFLDPATEMTRPSSPRNTPNPGMLTREVSISTSGSNRFIQAVKAAARWVEGRPCFLPAQPGWLERGRRPARLRCPGARSPRSPATSPAQYRKEAVRAHWGTGGRFQCPISAPIPTDHLRAHSDWRAFPANSPQTAV